jgi:glycosyltransferase involved in cell wall biosynthesis
MPASAAKILFISHEATRTGAPMFLLHLVRWLRRNTDLAFEVLLAKGGPLEEEFAKVAVVRAPGFFADNPGALSAFSLIYSNTICNGRLVDELPRGSIPVITHVHELDYGYDSLGARNMATVLRQTSHFIACAEAVADRLRTIFRILPERISVHHEVIDVEEVFTKAASVSAADLRTAYDLPADAAILAGCGTFDLRKAPDLFVQLAARIRSLWTSPRPLRFVWIGRMTVPELGKIVRHDIRRTGLQNEIKLIGELPSPHALLALADIFCLTSREDPFPLAMLEAAALGKPVVCFEGAGGGREFCDAGGGVAVPMLNIDAMARACLAWLTDPANQSADGARAAETVRTRFSIEAGMPALWADIQDRLRAPRTTALFPPDARLVDIYATWKRDEAPQPAAVEAILVRSATLDQADALVRSGRRAEAIKLMLQAVNVDLARKDAQILLDSLTDVAARLAPIEPRQAAFLREQAETLVRESRQPAAAA